MKRNMKLLVNAALLAAIVCVFTVVIVIPSFTGYINLGDCAVLISSWLLPPVWAAAACGIGSMAGDLITGYAVYAPATLVIKALMGFASSIIFMRLKKKNETLSLAVSGVAAEVIMAAGYFAFELILYGLAAAELKSLLGSLVQGAAGLVSAFAVYKLLPGQLKRK